MTAGYRPRASEAPIARWARRRVLDRAFRVSEGLPDQVARARFDGIAADVEDRVAEADRLRAHPVRLAAVLLLESLLRVPADRAWRREALGRFRADRPAPRPLPQTAVGRFDQTNGRIERDDGRPLGDGGRMRKLIWVGLINSVFLFSGH